MAHDSRHSRIVFRALAAVLLAVGVGNASARNDRLLLPIDAALQGGGTRQLLSADIPLRFGKASAAGAEVVPGTVEVHAVGDPYAGSNPNNNGGGKRERQSDERTCLDAFRKALVDLQQRALSAGAVAVVGIVSDYNHAELDSAQAYECHAGNSRTVVDLKGQLSRGAQPQPATATAVSAAAVAAVDPGQPKRIASGYAAIDDVDAMPYVSDRGRADYRRWLEQPTPKAFAISNAGHWFAASGLKPKDTTLPTDPVERALAGCSRSAQTPCKLYAVNGSVVWIKE
jgi:hypothetical protein